MRYRYLDDFRRGIYHFLLRYCGIGHPPMSPSLTINDLWTIPFKYLLPFPPQIFWLGGGGIESHFQGDWLWQHLSCIFGIFLRGLRKICYFWGGGRGTVSVPLIFLSFLLELIRHSDLAFHIWKFYHKGLKYLLVCHSNPTLCFQVLRTNLPQTRLAVWYFIFLVIFHFSNSFSLPVTLLFIIIKENLKKLIVNVNKQKDALKKNGITVDGVHYAVRFKGQFHIIINKVLFSTIIFNPNTCMCIDLFLKIYIYSYTWPEGPLSFAGTNRESKISAWEKRNWSRVLVCKALRVCGYIQNLWVNKFYYAGFDLTNDQL